MPELVRDLIIKLIKIYVITYNIFSVDHKNIILLHTP